MIYAVLILHVLICLGLIVAILFHNPRGTGLSSELSAGLSYTGKTVLERYLDRVTIGLGLGFMITTVLLLYLFR